MPYYPIFAYFESAPEAKSLYDTVLAALDTPSQTISVSWSDESKIFESSQDAKTWLADVATTPDTKISFTHHDFQIDLTRPKPTLVSIKIWEHNDDSPTPQTAQAQVQRVKTLCSALLTLGSTFVYGSIFNNKYAGEPDHYGILDILLDRLTTPAALRDYLVEHSFYFWWLGGKESLLGSQLGPNFIKHTLADSTLLWEQHGDGEPTLLD